MTDREKELSKALKKAYQWVEKAVDLTPEHFFHKHLLYETQSKLDYFRTWFEQTHI